LLVAQQKGEACRIMVATVPAGAGREAGALWRRTPAPSLAPNVISLYVDYTAPRQDQSSRRLSPDLENGAQA